MNDNPLSASSWAWFHFLRELVFTNSHQMSALYVCISMCGPMLSVCGPDVELAVMGILFPASVG